MLACDHLSARMTLTLHPSLAVEVGLTAAIVAWIIAAHAVRGPLVGEPRRGLAWYFGAPPAD